MCLSLDSIRATVDSELAEYRRDHVALWTRPLEL